MMRIDLLQDHVYHQIRDPQPLEARRAAHRVAGGMGCCMFGSAPANYSARDATDGSWEIVQQ